MRTLVYNDDERLIAWAQKRIGSTFRSDARAIGLARDSDIGDPKDPDRDSQGRLIVGSVVYDGFSSTDCNMHVASNGSGSWLNRAFLAASFAYPFVQCGLQRVTGLVPASNRRALLFDLNLGFRIEGLCREAMPNGEDLYVLGMLKRDCRFISKEHRQ